MSTINPAFAGFYNQIGQQRGIPDLYNSLGQSFITPEEKNRNDPNSPYFHPELSDIAGQKELRKIIANQGLSPEQRAMMSAAMSRTLGRATEADQEALSRRLAAQGISNTGLGNAALTGAQGNLLSAYQQSLSNVDQQSLSAYLNAVNALFGGEMGEAARRSAEKMQEEAIKGQLIGKLGQAAGSYAGGGSQ